MPRTAKLYITSVIVFGFALLAGCLAAVWQSADMARFLSYLAIAVLASTFKIRLPGIQGTISINFLLILMAIAELPLDHALLIGFAATAVQCYWRARKRPQAVQVAFNLAAVCISVGGAWPVRLLLSSRNQAACLALEATVFFLLNTSLVSIVLSLIGGDSVLEVWRRCHLYAFPYYLIGAVIADIASVSSRAVGWQASLLVLPLMLLVYAHYRLWVASAGRRQNAHAD